MDNHGHDPREMAAVHVYEQQMLDRQQYLQLEALPSILAFQVPNANNLHTRPVGSGIAGSYAYLLHVVEELGKDIRPSYSGGSKTSIERLKRNINQARIEIRQCLMELQRANRS